MRDGATNIPPLFVSAILASEDKNFVKHEGSDKAAILRESAKHLLQESRSGGVDSGLRSGATSGIINTSTVAGVQEHVE